MIKIYDKVLEKYKDPTYYYVSLPMPEKYTYSSLYIKLISD